MFGERGWYTVQRARTLFDAECVPCSANAQFVLVRDKKKAFYLAPIQGLIGTHLFRKHGLDPTTILVIDGTVVRKDSDASWRGYESNPTSKSHPCVKYTAAGGNAQRI